MQQFVPNYGFGYNPMLTPQQRVTQFEQQYPQFAQNSNQNLITYPVTNIEEANAFRVDLNGTPTFFYNAGKNEIYMKRTNTQTGLADFVVFGKVEQPKTQEKTVLNTNTHEKDFKALNDKIDGFYSKLDELYSLISNIQVSEKNEDIEENIKVKGGKNVK